MYIFIHIYIYIYVHTYMFLLSKRSSNSRSFSVWNPRMDLRIPTANVPAPMTKDQLGDPRLRGRPYFERLVLGGWDPSS